ncbi:malonate--CoA ligase ACSF3, mitochondrial-like [Lineus longissimus]|uniref:malonate--CoA ligase ACSF3, mitochondrial-like n=1 Tax=Lineus longissimus TaxID=88925 RepID=UPI00315CA69D
MSLPAKGLEVFKWRMCHACFKTIRRLSSQSEKSTRFYSSITLMSRRKTGSGVVTPVFIKAEDFKWRTALIDQNGSHTYGEILKKSLSLSERLLTLCGPVKDKFVGPRIAFLCPNDVSYVVSKWATWMMGGVAVPLSKSHPVSELEYFILDSRSSVVIATEEFEEKIGPLAEKLAIEKIILGKSDFLQFDDDVLSGESTVENRAESLDSIPLQSRSGRLKQNSKFASFLSINHYKRQAAMLIYTSGTTGRPKGVVHTHGSLHAQIEMMRIAWAWSKADTILHVLPLHHVHGIVNCLMTPMSCGATCVMLPKFDAKQVWSQLLDPVGENGARINVFMAVPTVYAKLIEYFEKEMGGKSHYSKEYAKSACMSRVRLMVSGSAALPQPIMKQWEDITGHRLLERYGMTEFGMGLTNSLSGERVPGAVGFPFPGVEVLIAEPDVSAENGYNVVAQGSSRSTKVTPGKEGHSGELYVRGPNVFSEYWNKPKETQETFTQDGWFKTGDTACFENGIYKILGRTSVDVIKSGGYKISALDIERHLLSHPDITDCAIVGLPDMTWGQKVAAVVVLQPGCVLTLHELKAWAKDLLPPYQIPTTLKCLDVMPRNAMGKVNKKELVKQVFPEANRRMI